MTKQEFAELYDSLYYGHDVELSLCEKRYFIEWTDSGIEVYLMINSDGTKLCSIFLDEKKDILEALFDFELDGQKCLNTSYTEIDIIDIE